MDDVAESVFLIEQFRLDEVDCSRDKTFSTNVTDVGNISQSSDNQLSSLLNELEERNAQSATSISSFMAVVASVNPPFKPRTLHRPWSISAGQGAHGSVEVHRYVPGRNFNVFNDSSPLKLTANSIDVKKTGDYYAVKRLMQLDETEDNDRPTLKHQAYSMLADELRILAHNDIQQHPNIVFLFGVSYTPSLNGPSLAEPNLVLQEGDCGDLFTFYRQADLRFDRHTLVEVKMSLCYDIACGLEALHRHGVVHCDLKPKNILVRRRHGRSRPIQRCKNELEAGQVAVDALTGNAPFVALLADFGGSFILSDDKRDAVHPKVWTPLWCAPECYSGAPIPRSLLSRIDIYSAGLIFAFIMMEGRDIFTKLVDHGRMHQYDITMDSETVQDIKVAGLGAKLAIRQVHDHEMMVFGITADERRIYYARDQQYPPSLLAIFGSILELALHIDPKKRPRNATRLLEPWARALEGNFHLDNAQHYSQPELFRSYAAGKFGRGYFRKGPVCASSDGTCKPVPPAFSNTEDEVVPGVFDVRKSFKIFRAGLTSGLKTEILKDMMHEVQLVMDIKTMSSPTPIDELVPPLQLQRAANAAYQVAVANIEGFGTQRNNQEALKWLEIACQLGDLTAQADFLPLAESLGLLNQRLGSIEMGIIIRRAADSVKLYGRQNTVNSLWNFHETLCASSISKYFDIQIGCLWQSFSAQTGLDKDVLFGGEDQTILQLFFGDSDINQPIEVESGWTILHYATLYGGLESVMFLVEDLGADVRSLSNACETALEVAMSWGHTDLALYLLAKHEEHQPCFHLGSCPLQSIAFLSAEMIPDFVYRILSIQTSPDVDARHKKTGRTALMRTMLVQAPVKPNSRRKAIETLLSYGANPLLTSIEPGTPSPLLLAVEEVDNDLVRGMLGAIKEHGHTTPVIDNRKARPEPQNELARSFLRLMQTPRSILMTRGGRNHAQAYESIITTILRYDIATELPFVCRGLEFDLLGLACYYGKAEAMKVILDVSKGKGPNVSKTLGEISGIDVIHTAIDCGFVETVDFLLPQLMIRSDIADYNLIISALHHQPALVPQLYSHFEQAGRGAETLAYKDPWGATALDVALEYGYLDLASFFLDEGASYDSYRLKGDHNVDDGEQSTLASVIPRLKHIEFLMALDPKPSLTVTSTGLNVFHILASDEKLIGTTVGPAEFREVLEYFYRLDPSLIHKPGGTRGFTPFHLVSLHYSEVVGRFLYEHDADINALSANGHTPLDLLHFHDSGERSVEEHLTIEIDDDTTRTGVAVCDYAFAGPAYWVREGVLSERLKSLYSEWGARRSV